MIGVGIGVNFGGFKIFKHALSFDGVNDFVDIADDASIHLSDTFTVMTWIKPTGNTNAFRIFFSKNFGAGQYPQFMVSNNNKIDWRANHDTTYGVLSTDTINLGQWYHVAGTYDANGGTGNSKLYVNGVLQNSETLTGSITNDTTALRFGNRAGSFPFKGDIYDMRIYDIALTQSEIQNVMNVELIGNESDLIGDWKMDEGSGTAINDSTSNGNDGTISGATWITF